MAKEYTSWSTRNELRFIDSLGTFTQTQEPRNDLLRKYLNGAALRTDWGQIDKQTVITRVQRELGGVSWDDLIKKNRGRNKKRKEETI